MNADYEKMVRDIGEQRRELLRAGERNLRVVVGGLAYMIIKMGDYKDKPDGKLFVYGMPITVDADMPADDVRVLSERGFIEYHQGKTVKAGKIKLRKTSLSVDEIGIVNRFLKMCPSLQTMRDCGGHVRVPPRLPLKGFNEPDDGYQQVEAVYDVKQDILEKQGESLAAFKFTHGTDSFWWPSGGGSVCYRP